MQTGVLDVDRSKKSLKNAGLRNLSFVPLQKKRLWFILWFTAAAGK